MQFPPPHYIFYEPLNDVETENFWKEYKSKFENKCEFTEIDASVMNSVDTFASWFDSWISQVPSKQSTRFRVLMIFHAHFLTHSCQQMLRRSLEQRSFKNRVWFHIEDPAQIQTAIQSRCIVKRMLTHTHSPTLKYNYET